MSWFYRHSNGKQRTCPEMLAFPKSTTAQLILKVHRRFCAEQQANWLYSLFLEFAHVFLIIP